MNFLRDILLCLAFIVVIGAPVTVIVLLLRTITGVMIDMTGMRFRYDDGRIGEYIKDTDTMEIVE